MGVTPALYVKGNQSTPCPSSCGMGCAGTLARSPSSPTERELAALPGFLSARIPGQHPFSDFSEPFLLPSTALPGPLSPPCGLGEAVPSLGLGALTCQAGTATLPWENSEGSRAQALCSVGCVCWTRETFVTQPQGTGARLVSEVPTLRSCGFCFLTFLTLHAAGGALFWL